MLRDAIIKFRLSFHEHFLLDSAIDIPQMSWQNAAEFDSSQFFSARNSINVFFSMTQDHGTSLGPVLLPSVLASVLHDHYNTMRESLFKFLGK